MYAYVCVWLILGGRIYNISTQKLGLQILLMSYLHLLSICPAVLSAGKYALQGTSTA